MTTTPKALEFSEDSRRAYVPAPHHDVAPAEASAPDSDDAFAVATDDANADDTTTPAAAHGPAVDEQASMRPERAHDATDDEPDGTARNTGE